MEESNELAIMASPDQQGAIEVRQQVNQIQYLMKQVLREGEHYGVIPGTGNKPSLLQSGAEKIAYMFHLVPKYEINRTDHQGGHREYEVTCTLTSRDTGEVMGYGVGICSTLESKYRYRSKWVNGSKQRIENPDIADVYNTVMKMAKKRAFVDAVKSTTAASDIFTQDVEDMPRYLYAEPRREPARPVEATVQRTAPTDGELEKLKAATARLVAAGYTEGDVKPYLWGKFKEGGIAVVDAEVEGMLAKAAQQQQVAEVEDVTDVVVQAEGQTQITAVEPDLYEEEVEF